MRLDNYNVTLTKYIWTPDTNPDDVNVFNIHNVMSVTEIDLKPYIIDISDIDWNLDTVDEEDGKSNLYFEESDISIDLSGIVNNNYLIDFFGIYRDTNLEKYVLKIKDITNNLTIYKGVVSQELLPIDFANDNTNKVISMTAFGYLKELKMYFSNKDIIHNSDLFWTRQQELPNVIRRDAYNRWGCSFRDLLTQTFAGTGITFILDAEVNKWYIVSNPILSKRVNYTGLMSDNTCWIKSSYERIRAHGENRFDLIRRICNAMGWIFYFSDNNFYVKNRVPVENSQTLDFKRIMNHTLHKQKNEVDYDNILILNGSMGVWTPFLKGERFKVITNKTTASERWWKNIGENDTNWRVFVEDAPDYWRHQIFKDESASNFRWNIWNKDNLESTQDVSQNTMLRIDAGHTGNEAWGYDTRNGSSFPREFTYNTGEEEIQFRGNYGSAMFKLVGQFPNQQVYTYEDFKESSIFNSNFQKFFNSNLSRCITLQYPEVIYNPLQKYTFINDDGKLDGEWTTISLKTNLLTQTSTLELQLKQE